MNPIFLLTTNAQRGYSPERLENFYTYVKVTLTRGFRFDEESYKPSFWCFQEITDEICLKVNEFSKRKNFKLIRESDEAIGILYDSLRFALIKSEFIHPDYLFPKYFNTWPRQKGFRLALFRGSREDQYKYFLVVSFHQPSALHVKTRLKFDRLMFKTVDSFIKEAGIDKCEVCCLIAGDGNHFFKFEHFPLMFIMATYGYKSITRGIGPTYNPELLEPYTKMFQLLSKYYYLWKYIPIINTSIDKIYLKDPKKLFKSSTKKIFKDASDHMTVASVFKNNLST